MSNQNSENVIRNEQNKNKRIKKRKHKENKEAHLLIGTPLTFGIPITGKSIVISGTYHPSPPPPHHIASALPRSRLQQPRFLDVSSGLAPIILVLILVLLLSQPDAHRDSSTSVRSYRQMNTVIFHQFHPFYVSYCLVLV
jgi:hypothetical protein